MSSSISRPGGLTAIALINIIFGFFALLATAVMFFADDAANFANQAMQQAAATPNLPPAQKAEYEAQMLQMQQAMEMLKDQQAHALHLPLLGLTAISAVAMFVSGIGLWRMKKFSGQLIGNIYVGSTILATIVGYVILSSLASKYPDIAQQQLLQFIGPIYALIVGFLINFTFSEDFE